jgi:hypothetical protein
MRQVPALFLSVVFALGGMVSPLQAQTCLTCTSPLGGECVTAPQASGYWLCNDMYCLDALCSEVACKRACPCTMDLLDCYGEGGEVPPPFDPPIIRPRATDRTVAARAMLWKRVSEPASVSSGGPGAPDRPIHISSFEAQQIAEAIARHTQTRAEEWAVSFAHISYAPSGKAMGFVSPAGGGYVLQVVPQPGGSLVVVRAAESGAVGRRLASGHVAMGQVLLAPVELDGDRMFLAVDAAELPTDVEAAKGKIDELRRPFVDGLRAYPRKQGGRDLEPRILQ